MSKSQQQLKDAGWRIVKSVRHGAFRMVDWICPYTREVFRQGTAVEIETARRRIRKLIVKSVKMAASPDTPQSQRDILIERIARMKLESRQNITKMIADHWEQNHKNFCDGPSEY